MNMPSLVTAISTGAPAVLMPLASGEIERPTIASPRVSTVSMVPEKSTCWNGFSSLILSSAWSTSYSEPKNSRAVISTTCSRPSW